MNENSSTAQFYGLNEFPFEPTGAASDKYPYVPPKRFDIIESKIEEVVREKKLYVILFRAPQGGGKTATTAELRRRVEARKYAGGEAALVMNKLVDLDFSHYAHDFIESSKTFLPDLKWEKWEKYESAKSPGELRNAVISLLKTLAEKHRLVVWIIDEFDILVDFPKEKQSQFLQILREIVDELANESLPLLFIMSHTMKSSKEFENYLKTVHGPFQSRIVASLEIGYTFSEAKNIVAARLRAVRQREQPYNSLEPFTEESIKTLYELVVSAGGTGELNDFRFFERCCYFSLLKGAQHKIAQIDPAMVKLVFEESYKSWAKTQTFEKISVQVQSLRAGILTSSQMSRNEAILNGIKRGLELTEDQFRSIPYSTTVYGEKLNPDIHISGLQVELEHKPSGKRIVSDWILVARDGGLIFQDDMKRFDSAVTKVIAKLGMYPNATVFAYVSDLDLDRSAIRSTDEVIAISSETGRDLIGLGLKEATEDDTDELRKSFDAEIAPVVRKLYTEKTNDLAKRPADSVYRLIKTANLAFASGRKLTRESLKELEKTLLGSSVKIADRHVAEAIELGFLREQGSELIPTIPRTLDHLLSLLVKGPRNVKDIKNEFGTNTDLILETAGGLGIIDRDLTNDQVRLRPDDTNQQLLNRELPELREIASRGENARSFGAERTNLIFDAFEKTKSHPDHFASNIVSATAVAVIPELKESLTRPLGTSSGLRPKPTSKQSDSITVGARKSGEGPSSPGATSLPLENLINNILEIHSLTLGELVSKVSEKGGVGDVRSSVLRMVFANKLKLST